MQIEVPTIRVIQYLNKLDIVYDREKKIFAIYVSTLHETPYYPKNSQCDVWIEIITISK